jgi:hypothetical protein
MMLTAGALAAAGTMLLFTTVHAQQPAKEKWLHVSVESREANGETVRVNVPLALAERVLPAINIEKLRHGRIRINEFKLEGMDVREILAAVKDTRDGEFVTVESRKNNVRVAKEKGYLLVKAEETKEVKGAKEGETRTRKEKVDVKIPMTVVEALLSGAKDEIDLVAAIRALAAHGDAVLVSVEDGQNTVRIWVDSQNTSRTL